MLSKLDFLITWYHQKAPYLTYKYYNHVTKGLNLIQIKLYIKYKKKKDFHVWIGLIHVYIKNGVYIYIYASHVGKGVFPTHVNKVR